MKWVKHTEDVYLPDYLKEGLNSHCQYCGYEMENYYNDDYRCTNRRCSNPLCSGAMAAKGAFMLKLLGYKGAGFASCLKAIEEHALKSHVRLLRVLTDTPTISLQEYLRIHCFPGVDSEWEKICQTLSLYNLDELFERYDGKHKQLLEDNKELLYSNLDCVKLTERPKGFTTQAPVKYLNIMITGTPNGFDNKDHFINTMNAALHGKIVILHQKTKRMTGVDFLIREPGSTTRGKYDAALRGGIPIVTSKEFVQIVLNMVSKGQT